MTFALNMFMLVMLVGAPSAYATASTTNIVATALDTLDTMASPAEVILAESTVINSTAVNIDTGINDDDDWGDVEEVSVVKATVIDYYGDNYLRHDRSLNLLTGEVMRAGSTLFTIAHRTNQPYTTLPWDNLMGFDGGGLKISLGGRYGFLSDQKGMIKGLDMGMVRTNDGGDPFDTVELDVRVQLTSRHSQGVDTAIRIGASWFVQPETADALAPFAQLLLSRVIARRLLLSGGLVWHGDSSGGEKNTADKAATTALQFSADYRITNNMAFSAEVVRSIAGYHTANSDTEISYPAITLGPKFLTHRHSFAVVISNTRYTGADGVITGAYRKPNNWIFGFNIVREL